MILIDRIRGYLRYGRLPTKIDADGDPLAVFVKVIDLDNPKPDPPVYYKAVDTKAGTATIYRRSRVRGEPDTEEIKGRFRLEWDLSL